MNRRDYLALTGTALTTAVAGCSGSGDGPPKEAEEPNEPAAGEEGSNTEAPEEKPQIPTPRNNQNPNRPKRSTNPGAVVLRERCRSRARRPDRWGLTVVEATHTNGESNFQVSLVGGEFDDLFVNAIGEYGGDGRLDRRGRVHSRR